MRGFIDDVIHAWLVVVRSAGLNPRSCAASSMTATAGLRAFGGLESQSAFVRGFIDDCRAALINRINPMSQSAFVRGFIDDR